MEQKIEIFIQKILRCDGITMRQVAVHEAGHRFFWQGSFPEVKTKYAVVRGTPSVIREDGEHVLKIADLTEADAIRYVYIKLGGIAAEMILFGLDQSADEIADWIADDYLTETSVLDWKDDAAHGGDIPGALTIIQAKAGANSLKRNFKLMLRSCIDNILRNKAAFDEECAETEKLFAVWEKQGMWSLH